MTSWCIAAGAGGLVLLGLGFALGRWLRNRPGDGDYLTVLKETEPADPLLQSQIAASLGTLPRPDLFAGLRAWANGGAPGEIDDLRQQVRTLQVYVLGMDTRYAQREQVAWISLTVFALAFGILGAGATIVWAAVELLGGK
jgi:hypothetical protein